MGRDRGRGKGGNGGGRGGSGSRGGGRSGNTSSFTFGFFAGGTSPSGSQPRAPGGYNAAAPPPGLYSVSSVPGTSAGGRGGGGRGGKQGGRSPYFVPEGRGRGGASGGGGMSTSLPANFGAPSGFTFSGGGSYSGGKGRGAAASGGRGRGGHHHHHGRGQLVAGQPNQFIHTELEPHGIWKVSVPVGQRFSKSFLAGLEVWAMQMMSGQECQLSMPVYGGGQLTSLLGSAQKPGAGSPVLPSGQSPVLPAPPPPPPRVSASGLPSSSEGAAGAAASWPPPPPTPIIGFPSGGLTAGETGQQGTPAPGLTSPPPPAADGPLDFLSFLTGAAGASTPSSTNAARAPVAAPAPDDSTFYRPAIKDRPPAEAAPASAGGSAGTTQAHGIDPQSSAAAEDKDENESETGEWDPHAAAAAGGGNDAVATQAGGRREPQASGKGEEGEEGGDDDDEDEDDGYHYSDLSARDLAGDGHSAEFSDDGEDVSDEEEGEEVTSPPPFKTSTAGAQAAAVTPAPAQHYGNGLLQPSPASAGFAVTTPAAHAAAGTPGTGGGAVPAGGRVLRIKHDSPGAPVRISLHLERQGLTDPEVQLVARWYKERVSGCIEFAKLWLFDNRIGDEGAAAVAELLHPALLEIHLSHNGITSVGARTLLGAAPVERTVDRPLWLRMEWNIINVQDLLEFADVQRQQRGLRVEVPEVVAAGPERGHEMNLKLRNLKPGGASQGEVHVRLPWFQCQKQPPSESAVLLTMKDAYRILPPQKQPSSSSAAATAGPRAPVSLATPPAPVTQAPAPAQSQAATAKATPQTRAQPVSPAAGLDGQAYGRGPLLIFPDTSALLSMLGANIDIPKPSLTLEALTSLARGGRFGRRGIAAEDQVFIVVADSVMKQLDGLKSLPEARAAIRRFFGEGLEECGPAGLDFLTVLGAHEGEGLALEAGSLGVAGSKSPFMANKGQQVDYRIVEVALFFQREITRAWSSGGMGSGSQSPRDVSESGAAIGGGSSSGGAGLDGPGIMPVLLLSNDNAQISAAKAHGLPAYRLASAGQELSSVMLGLQSGAVGGVLSSGTLRALLGPAATSGLGSAAGRSLQEQFDEAVAALRAAQGALAVAATSIASATAAATAGASSTPDALQQVLTVLQYQPPVIDVSAGSNVSDAGGGRGEEEVEAGAGSSTLASSLAQLVEALENQLIDWEAAVRVAQQPSRVLKWAGLGAAAGAGQS